MCHGPIELTRLGKLEAQNFIMIPLKHGRAGMYLETFSFGIFVIYKLSEGRSNGLSKVVLKTLILKLYLIPSIQDRLGCCITIIRIIYCDRELCWIQVW